MSEDNAIRLAEAVAQVDTLDELLSTVDDNQPRMESQPGCIRYQVNFNTNFEDRNGFITGIAKYTEEATVHAALNEVLEEGERHAIMLYTWRCCSRGIPQPKSNEDPNREQIHMMTVEILLPEVDKLYSLMRFQKTAIDLFCSEVKKLCRSENRKEFVSSAYLLTLGKFINMFAILDELKNIKSSVKIDFSTFRRAALFLKLINDSRALQESQNLSVFLATPNKIQDNLRENLEKLQNYEDVIADVINICVHRFENKLYVTLNEKHMLVKVIGFCLGLVNKSRCNLYKLDKKKKIKIDKIDKIFKTVEVVPLYGDMQISPFNYIKNCTNYNASKWPNCSAKMSDTYSQVDLVKLLPSISQEHLKYLSELHQYNSPIFGAEVSSEVENEKVSNLALKGLQLLSKWTSAVLELHSWKLLHPTDHHLNRECPQDAEEYERATRYNYSDAEKSALVQVIGMIKGLQNEMSQMDLIFSEGVRRDIYLKLQTFVQVTLREPIRKAFKNKKSVLSSVLMSIRETCVEWMEGATVLVSQDQINKSQMEMKILKRCVGPSSTQLYLLRTMLESLTSSKTFAKHSLRKDLDVGCHVPKIEEFLGQTFFWNYLLNFSEVLEKCCDLSQLWYREFYLELTMGERIQFPIEMSMPWILIDHVLTHPSLIEFALFPLDLYNDSADCALNVFGKQWLFDELVAEVNLCFDQFVFKLSEQIFTHFKRMAASSLLNSKFRRDWMAVSNDPIAAHKPVKYEGLMQQRRVHLLGHYIDLNKLLRQRISSDLQKSLQAALSKFEEGDLTGVVQLDALIRVNRETHKLLQRWIPSLDDFDMIWCEANQCVTAPHGRTTFHILSEITGDLIPDYCYNGSTKRFVRAEGVTYTRRDGKRRTAPPVPPQYLWGSKQLNTAYSMVFSRYSGFVGEPHFSVIVKLLVYQGLSAVMKEIFTICEELINGGIRQWVQVLKDSVLPKYVKAPSKPLNDEGTPGLLAYYIQVLSSVIQHPGIKMELFQHFREVGNAVLFCMMAENSLAAEETLQMCHVVPFQGVQQQQWGENSNRNKDKGKAMDDIEQMLEALHVSGNIGLFGTETQRNLAREAELLSGELLTFGLRIFPEILKEIKKMLVGKEEVGENNEQQQQNGDEKDAKKRVWTGPPAVNHVMNMHRCGEFHRVWSALQFMSCIPVGSNEFSVEQLFGDGLNWAGCLFIALLGQQKRFETFDFCNHLWESYREDNRDGDVRGINVRQTMGRIRGIQLLNSGIFSIISRNLTDSVGTTLLASENVRCFHPPIHKSLFLNNAPNDIPSQQTPPNLLERNGTPLNTHEEETGSITSGEISLNEVVVTERKTFRPSAQGDHWDNFGLLDEQVGLQDRENEQEDGQASSVDVLFQNEQGVDEIDSVSSVAYGGATSTTH